MICWIFVIFMEHFWTVDVNMQIIIMQYISLMKVYMFHISNKEMFLTYKVPMTFTFLMFALLYKSLVPYSVPPYQTYATPPPPPRRICVTNQFFYGKNYSSRQSFPSYVCHFLTICRSVSFPTPFLPFFPSLYDSSHTTLPPRENLIKDGHERS